MLPELRAIAATQQGLFTRAQAVETGHRTCQLKGLLKPNGEWVKVRRGVFMERSLWDSLDEYDEKWAARDWAAHLAMREDHVLSHDSAARAHGLPMLAEHRQLVHVTRPWVTGSRTDAGVKHHLNKDIELVRENVRGLPVTGLARTAVDLAREHGELAGLIACDAVLRRSVAREELNEVTVAMRNWPGITRAQRAIQRADAGADTIAETLARDLVEEAGLGRAQTQFPVHLGNRTVWVDLRIGRHLVEVDGRIKYIPEVAGGVATAAPDQVFFDQMERQTGVTGMGFGMSRLVFRDFFGARRKEAIARLQREYAVSVERFGTVLTPEMLAFEARMRGTREARIFGSQVRRGA